MAAREVEAVPAGGLCADLDGSTGLGGGRGNTAAHNLVYSDFTAHNLEKFEKTARSILVCKKEKLVQSSLYTLKIWEPN